MRRRWSFYLETSAGKLAERVERETDSILFSFLSNQKGDIEVPLSNLARLDCQCSLEPIMIKVCNLKLHGNFTLSTRVIIGEEA